MIWVCEAVDDRRLKGVRKGKNGGEEETHGSSVGRARKRVPPRTSVATKKRAAMRRAAERRRREEEGEGRCECSAAP